MSDSSNEDSYNSSFISEIINLKKSEEKYQSLLSLLYLYKSQVTELELEISDLKALIKARDFEITSYNLKNHSRSLSQNLDLNQVQTIPSLKSSRNTLEADNLNLHSLKTQLNLAKEKNLALEEENSRLSNIMKSPDLKNELLIKDSEIKSLVSIVHKLREENEDLKVKNIEEHSTAVKSFNTSEVKSFEVPADTDSGSAAESTPRFESSIQEIKEFSYKAEFPKNFLVSGPQPPKTRIELSTVAMQKTQKIKHVSCDLSDINQPLIRYCDLAEFYPKYTRRFK